MRLFTAHNAHSLYREQLSALITEGENVHVRGKDTKELLNVITEIRYPEQRVHIVPGREWNPFLALSECLWLLAERNDVATLYPYNKRILEYSDDGKTLYGAYGYRIKDQIEPLIKRLQRDSNDRRAVLSIWRPEDLTANTKDAPCNDVIMFKLRNNELHMTVFCRSNDLHFGLYAVNLPVFSFLQEYIAARLNVAMGTQTHISNSLHIYTKGPGAAITERMLEHIDKELPPIPWGNKVWDRWKLPPHPEVVELCSKALEHRITCPELPFLEFASDFLELYRLCKRRYAPTNLMRCRHYGKYPDWITAAEEFAN